MGFYLQTTGQIFELLVNVLLKVAWIYQEIRQDNMVVLIRLSPFNCVTSGYFLPTLAGAPARIFLYIT